MKVIQGDYVKLKEIATADAVDPLGVEALEKAGSDAFWATFDKVFRLSRQGGEPQVFEAPFGEPKGVTEFDGILYVTGETGIFRIHVGDGDTLALDPRGFTGLTLGCDGLYLVGWYESILLRYGR